MLWLYSIQVCRGGVEKSSSTFSSPQPIAGNPLLTNYVCVYPLELDLPCGRVPGLAADTALRRAGSGVFEGRILDRPSQAGLQLRLESEHSRQASAGTYVTVKPV